MRRSVNCLDNYYRNPIHLTYSNEEVGRQTWLRLSVQVETQSGVRNVRNVEQL
jgi:hypothetical protein